MSVFVILKLVYRYRSWNLLYDMISERTFYFLCMFNRYTSIALMTGGALLNQIWNTSCFNFSSWASSEMHLPYFYFYFLTLIICIATRLVCDAYMCEFAFSSVFISVDWINSDHSNFQKKGGCRFLVHPILLPETYADFLSS